MEIIFQMEKTNELENLLPSNKLFLQHVVESLDTVNEH